MKRLMSFVTSGVIIAGCVTNVVSCADYHYVRLDKNLAKWDVTNYGLFNNEVGIKVLNNNTTTGATAVWHEYTDGDEPRQESLSTVYKDCFDSGISAKDHAYCHVKATNVVKSFIYYYELATKKDEAKSLVVYDGKHHALLEQSFEKMETNLDITISTDEQTAASDDDVLIHDNSNNTPGYFSFFVAFGVKIVARDHATESNPTKDGYFNAIKAKNSDYVPVLISFQEGF